MVGELRRTASLLKCAVAAAALGVLLASAAQTDLFLSAAYASGPDDPDDFDEPDFDEPDEPDEPDFDEPDEPDEVDMADNSDFDDDSSGHGSGDDDDADDFDNSGSGSDDSDNDSDDSDNSGSGSDDDDDDNSGSGHSGSDDDDDDNDDNSGSSNSGSGSSGSGRDDDRAGNSGSGSGHSGAANSGSGNSGPGNSGPGNSGSGNSGSGNSGSGSNNSGHGSGNSGSGSSNSGSGSESGSEHNSNAHEESLYAIERDARGNERVADEVVLIGDNEDHRSALNHGFSDISVQRLSSGGVMARLATPHGVGVDDAIAMLARAAPDAIVTANSIYRSAQTTRTVAAHRPAHRPQRLRGAMGVIDTGVDVAALPAADAVLSHNSFAGPQPVARAHGSAVASIAVSRGVRVHVADVFGHSADGALAASAERIAAAVDWMIAQRVPVVNISVEGPNNAALAEMIRRAAQRGHIIVAAAGNGGPAARPAFPAAFDGVLAVTAIDETGQPYVRANRGAYIDFAAPGVHVSVDMGGETTEVSGTSFAAPVVAAEAAARMSEPSPAASSRVLSHLRNRAEDLGAPGRDNIFGWGALRD